MCMAHVEAFIDFGEDEGIEDDVMTEALRQEYDLVSCFINEGGIII